MDQLINAPNEMGFTPQTLFPQDFKPRPPESIVCEADDSIVDILNDEVEVEQTMSTFVPHDCDDRIRSGESLFKMLLFEPSQYTDETEKIISFWKYLKERSDIHPTPCDMMYRRSREIPRKTRDNSCQTDDGRMTDLIEFNGENCPWTRALGEIERLNLASVSRAATRKAACKLCRDEELESETDDVINVADVEEMNQWDPLRKSYADKESQYPYDEIFLDECDSVNSWKLLHSPQPGDKVLGSTYPMDWSKANQRVGKRKDKSTNTYYNAQWRPLPEVRALELLKSSQVVEEESEESKTDEDILRSLSKRVSFIGGRKVVRVSRGGRMTSILKISKESLLQDDEENMEEEEEEEEETKTLKETSSDETPRQIISLMTAALNLDVPFLPRKKKNKEIQTNDSSSSELVGSYCLICGREHCDCTDRP